MPGASSDPYKIPGIAQGATRCEVKKAYRSLAMKFHPDHNSQKCEAAEHFKQIQQAYETLTGPRKQDRISPASFAPGEHPFFSFYWAMKTHGDWIVKNMKSNSPDEQENKNDV